MKPRSSCSVRIERNLAALPFGKTLLLWIAAALLHTLRTDKAPAVPTQIADVSDIPIVRDRHLIVAVLASHVHLHAKLDLALATVRVRIEALKHAVMSTTDLGDVHLSPRLTAARRRRRLRPPHE